MQELKEKVERRKASWNAVAVSAKDPFSPNNPALLFS